MGTLKVDTIQDSGGNTILSSDGSGGFTNSLPAGKTSSYRNLIINGDMSIAQRGTSVSGITSSAYRTMDRWYFNTDLGTWTMSQSTDVPTGQGFGKSLKLDCTTANASPSTGNFLVLEQRIEGQNLQQLKKGTSNAESLTLSFWVKSSKTGTYIAELFDNDNSRQISQAYTISSASTWEKKTLTFAGDTTGSLDNDNANSFTLALWLGGGSTWTSGTLNTSWNSNTNANRAVGVVNLADSTANELYITGVQLEVGTTASDFEFLPIDVNLQRCARYFQQIGNTDYTDTPPGGGRLAIGLRDNSSSAYFYPKVPLMAPIRARPSISFNNVNVRQDGTGITLSSTDTIRNYGSFIGFNAQAASNLTVSNAAELRFNGSDAYMRIDAEL